MLIVGAEVGRVQRKSGVLLILRHTVSLYVFIARCLSVRRLVHHLVHDWSVPVLCHLFGTSSFVHTAPHACHSCRLSILLHHRRCFTSSTAEGYKLGHLRVRFIFECQALLWSDFLRLEDSFVGDLHDLLFLLRCVVLDVMHWRGYSRGTTCPIDLSKAHIAHKRPHLLL